MQKVDLKDKEFGNLLVLREGNGKMVGKTFPKKRTTWICFCKACGKEKEMLTTNIKKSDSCGCKFLSSEKYNFEDLTNKEFGLLKVKSKSDKKTKTRGCIWVCECECGKIVEIATNGLTSFNNVTCGNRKVHQYYYSPRIGGIIPNSHINHIKQNAIKRNLKFDLSDDYLLNLFLSQDGKCILSGIELKFTDKSNASATRATRATDTTASLDRIDNNLGYIEGNVRWVHKDVNKMRSNHSDDYFIEFCRKCYLNSFEKQFDRPSFQEYFMLLAFNISLRSEDINIKHGAIIVNNFNHIIGTGYNATIQGSDKSKIELHIRDKKRPWMIHAEENAILNCTKNPKEIGGATLYVTGLPCVNCLQRVINFGISKIVFANRMGSITENSETQEMREKIIEMSKVEIVKFSVDNKWLKRALI